jgi:hypothetical protein
MRIGSCILENAGLRLLILLTITNLFASHARFYHTVAPTIGYGPSFPTNFTQFHALTSIHSVPPWSPRRRRNRLSHRRRRKLPLRHLARGLKVPTHVATCQL